MARVPVYTDLQQTLRPVGGQMVDVRATPQAFGADIGRGLSDVGQGVDDVYKARQAIQARDDEALVKQRVDQLQDKRRELLLDPENGYLGKRGQSAVDGRSQMEADMAAARQEAAKGLTPAQLRLYDPASTQLENSTLDAVVTHAGQERKTWYDEASKARAGTWANDAVAGYGDDKTVDFSIAAGAREIQQMAQDQGWSPEQTQAAFQKYQSGILRNVALRRIEDDPLAAKTYIDGLGDRLTGQDRYEIEKGMRPELVQAEARRAAADILGPRGSVVPSSQEPGTSAAPVAATSDPSDKDATPVVRRGANARYQPGTQLSATAADNPTRTYLFSKYGNKARSEDIDGLDATFADNLAAMIQDAPADIRGGLGITSGYRSFVRQKKLYEGSDKSGRMVARPGRSRHEHGNAVDLNFNGARLDKAPPRVREWVKQNARSYGLTLPMSYEPWHIEPIGARADLGGQAVAGVAVGAKRTVNSGRAGAVGGVPATRVSTLPPSVQGQVQAESSGNPNAVSSVGALGLMQIMPTTAPEIATELKDKNFPRTRDEQATYLKRTDVSLAYGIHYRNKLYRRFGEDWQATLVGYNAGPSVAERWLASGKDNSILPKETVGYLEKMRDVPPPTAAELAGSGPGSPEDILQGGPVNPIELQDMPSPAAGTTVTGPDSQPRRVTGSTVVQRSDTLSPRAQAPSVDEIEERLSQIADPEVQDAARTRVYAQLAAQERAAEAQEKAAKADLWSIIDAGGTPDDATSEQRQAAGMANVSAAWGYVESRNKRGGVEVENDQELLYELRRMSATDPQSFADVDILDYRDVLDTTAIKELTDTQTRILTPDKSTKNELKFDGAMTIANTTLDSIGLGVEGKKGAARDEVAERRARFQNALWDQMTEFKERTGQNPVDTDIKRMVQDLTLPIVLDGPDGWFSSNDREGFAFEAPFRGDDETVRVEVPLSQIPVEIRLAMRDSLRAELGRAPNDEELVAEYARFVTQSRPK